MPFQVPVEIVPKEVMPVISGNDPEMVFESPDLMVLLVKVSVEVLATKVSVMSGIVIVLFDEVGVQVKVPVVPVEKVSWFLAAVKLIPEREGEEVVRIVWFKSMAVPEIVSFLDVFASEITIPSLVEEIVTPLISFSTVRAPLIMVSALISR